MPDAIAVDLSARFQQGLAQHRAGALDRAAEIYGQVLAAAPAHFDALHMLGVVHLHRGEAREAADLILKAISVDARQPAAYGNLAVALMELMDFRAAIDFCDRALALKSDDVEALHTRGGALRRLGREGDARSSFDRALALQPGHLPSRISRGALLRDLGEPDLALTDLDAAVQAGPDVPLSHYNRGNVLKDLNRLPEAEAAFRNAISLAADFAEAHVALAESLFLLGRDAEAWPEYEWRWRTAKFQSVARAFTQPRWTGQGEVKGKTLLIHAEQGFGDAVQFARYVPLLKDRRANVVLQVPTPLAALMSRLPGVASVISNDDELPAFDMHCPLMSLPLALCQTAPAPAYLSADPGRIEHWRAQLGPGRQRIGLVWSGSTIHANDRNRSIPLWMLEPLLNADASFVSLHKDVREADRAALGQFKSLVSVPLGDLADTAALIAALDLVISVDTVTAHLAGALGKPVWILLPHAPDWRWGLSGTTTHWYPSAKLYRQPARGDWASVVARIAADAKAFAP
jgi:tetratricopeptide (TPR) repeat protein